MLVGALVALVSLLVSSPSQASLPAADELASPLAADPFTQLIEAEARADARAAELARFALFDCVPCGDGFFVGECAEAQALANLKVHVGAFDLGLAGHLQARKGFNPRIAVGVHVGSSAYAFAGNDPTNFGDPIGLQTLPNQGIPPSPAPTPPPPPVPAHGLRHIHGGLAARSAAAASQTPAVVAGAGAGAGATPLLLTSVSAASGVVVGGVIVIGTGTGYGFGRLGGRYIPVGNGATLDTLARDSWFAWATKWASGENGRNLRPEDYAVRAPGVQYEGEEWQAVRDTQGNVVGWLNVADPSMPPIPALNREEIIARVSGIVQPHLGAIHELDPNALVGFRGSLARGFKGPHKGNVPFDPNDFDVDAFIVSDQLAALVPANRAGFRNARSLPGLAVLQNDIGMQLLGSLPGLRHEKFTFRIYTRAELEAKVGQAERYFFGE